MIKLTRLNGEQFLLNAELIRYVEACPDTFVTLTCGDRVVVRQTLDEVLGLALEYQRSKSLLPQLIPPRAAAAPLAPRGSRSQSTVENLI
jgi:flagellar protein FlbD